MKNKLILSIIALAAFGMTSCDQRGKLAENIQGTWTGTPESVLDTGAAKATAIRSYDFAAMGATEGSVTATVVINVENSLPMNGNLTTPIQITSAGTATINGTYRVKDDDELDLLLDANTLTVNVNPGDVDLGYNALTEESATDSDTLHSGAVVLATQQITRAAQMVFANNDEIDDIHITGNTMRCEIGHRDYVLTR